MEVRIRRNFTEESDPSAVHHVLCGGIAVMRFDFQRNAPDHVGINSAGNGEMAGGVESALLITKKRRGRPRKYNFDYEKSVPVCPERSSSSCDSKISSKRRRGRPRGGGRLQLLASLGGYAWDTAGGSFTPHVVHIAAGEDIVERVASFSRKGPRAICILAATGSVSTVLLHQPASKPSTVLRFQGVFEILRLSGSFVRQMNRSYLKKGQLTISLAKPDGRVFGGAVATSLVAASPIQIIVGSFKQKLNSTVRKTHITGDSQAGAEEEETCDTPSTST